MLKPLPNPSWLKFDEPEKTTDVGASVQISDLAMPAV